MFLKISERQHSRCGAEGGQLFFFMDSREGRVVEQARVKDFVS